ncbi:proton-coupled folate transporter-like isoform X2 [Branchiostoma lanceolatum]|uniref:proton-coupled folate transporter-like isoform X2 n=1 Tax=Branchiostoma lanceolatum TaxID=7740 RepID=UPI0034524066
MAAEEEADPLLVGTTAPPADKESTRVKPSLYYTSSKPEVTDRLLRACGVSNLRLRACVIQARVKPYCPVTVEPIAFFLVLSTVMVMPLQQQYIYYKLGNDTLPSSSRCDVNTSHPASKANQKVAAESANWLTYIRLCVSLPSLLMVLVLGSLSDRLGRKVTIIAPIIGTLIWLLLSALVVYLDLPLAMFLIGSFVFGMMGGSASFITGCTAYIADITGKGKSREVRLAIAGSAAGVALIPGVLVGGFWLKALGPPLGFQEPYWLTVGLMTFCLLYALFALKETRPKRPGSKICSLSYIMNIVSLVKRIRKPQRWIMGTLMLVYFLVHSVQESVSGVRTIILLSPPYCWNPVLIGVAGAVVGVAYVMSVLGIKVLGRWLSSYGLVQVGCVSAISGLVLQALAVYTSNHTTAFFIGLGLNCLQTMPSPILLAVMSRMVSREDQGSLFALAAFLDNIGDLVFVPFLNFLYAETLSVMPGLVLLVCAGIYLMCSTLIGVLQCYDSPTGYESIPQGINEDLE